MIRYWLICWSILNWWSTEDTPYFWYFSSPQGSTSVAMLQIISKVSDATWLNLVKSAGSSVLWIDYVVDRCSKMRPFSEAGKVKSSTSLSQKCKIIANICEHCGIVHSLIRLIVYLKYTAEDSHLGFPEIVWCSVNHREAIEAKLILSLTRLSFPLVRFRHWL